MIKYTIKEAKKSTTRKPQNLDLSQWSYTTYELNDLIKTINNLCKQGILIKISQKNEPEQKRKPKTEYMIISEVLKEFKLKKVKSKISDADHRTWWKQTTSEMIFSTDIEEKINSNGLPARISNYDAGKIYGAGWILCTMCDDDLYRLTIYKSRK